MVDTIPHSQHAAMRSARSLTIPRSQECERQHDSPNPCHATGRNHGRVDALRQCFHLGVGAPPGKKASSNAQDCPPGHFTKTVEFAAVPTRQFFVSIREQVIDMTFRPGRPFNDLPALPPAQNIETKSVLKAGTEARAALAELRVSWQIIPNQADQLHPSSGNPGEFRNRDHRPDNRPAFPLCR
ncbi:hypothetical protein [uncultured Paracoccus sp.]|uniref:hypothetical protein n=1 Tax=uncultured Paracoccus sp. TaxID=189685 RepID=UPI002600CCA4|nr:hypothetical protein [uncultured Paracoccus sp.]